MDLCDLTPSYVRAIAPYQPGKPISELAREMGIAERDIVKLASNENPRGVSPLAAAAMRAVLDDLARYPDGNGFELKQALAARYRVAPESIVLGNGSNDVLDIAARVFLAPGTSAIYSQHAFAVYPIAAQTVGARGIEVPARAFGHDLDAMLAAVRPDTRVVFIANPNNPTGTFLRGPQLLAFLQALPASVALVLDEAYTEYLAEEVRYDSIGWLARFPNLIVTRTFSKAYGLAGLRVGYALAHPPVADLMNRVRQPFNVNSLSLAAATAALGDAEFVRSSHELNLRGMRQLTDGFARLGVEYIPSYGNFVSCRVGDGGAVFERLLRRGVIVRPIGGYGMPEYLRVSVGLESENARFLAALAECLARG
ncbi:MAG TPA: histidinol-phosphate transaminase [Burkholderiales bacterium]|nr:histidinol-phosphate transaminase [Burkholderiales bacterium]